MSRAAFLSFSIFTACVAMLCIFLGAWQLQRHFWKAELLEAANSAVSNDPVPLLSANSVEAYTRLVIEGRFIGDKDIIIRGYAVKGASGARVYSPFELKDGRIIVVRRGWVARNREPELELFNTDFQQIEAIWRPVVRRTSDRSLFSPVNDAERNFWTFVDPVAFGEAWNLSGVMESGYLELRGPLSASEGLLIEDFTSDLFNRHMEYVVTWWSLAAALLGIFGIIWRNRLLAPR
ncbi:MAG: SURF1 family protein [Alphaproteobacteria bacterium]